MEKDNLGPNYFKRGIWTC